MKTDYKTVFQLAQDKGYGSLKVLTNYQNLFESEISSIYQSEITPDDLDKIVDADYLLLELTLIQKWLRDKHKIDVVSLAYTMSLEDQTKKYIWMIYKKSASTANKMFFDSYEDALLNGIHEALKLL